MPMSGIYDMTPWSLRTAVTPDTVKIMKNFWYFRVRAWNTKLCILVDPFLRNCVTKSNFRYLKKKPKKRLRHLKDQTTNKQDTNNFVILVQEPVIITSEGTNKQKRSTSNRWNLSFLWKKPSIAWTQPTHYVRTTLYERW